MTTSKLPVRPGPAQRVALNPLNTILDHGREADLSSVVTPARPTSQIVRYLLVQCTDQNIRYTIAAGSSPETALGFRMTAGNDPILIPVEGPDVVPRFIEETAGAVLEYVWCE
jgi:hypothetical protein